VRQPHGERGHALVAREVVRGGALDAVDVGPFGNTAEGSAESVVEAVAELLHRTLAAGATRVSLQVNVLPEPESGGRAEGQVEVAAEEEPGAGAGGRAEAGAGAEDGSGAGTGTSTDGRAVPGAGAGGPR